MGIDHSDLLILSLFYTDRFKWNKIGVY